jgi:hypothetical protein
MFYAWLVDESAAAPTPEEPDSPPARNNALPSCAAAIDALWLFSKYSRVHSPSLRRFADF